ncbi:hypothetical protein Sphch_3221 [Sphingobium chlorophenolicum L-1]|uniref:Uncharacterized protein n=1 Tax=Sphingobium chlorophenolicum L-1 TaxID=690566 RepID=F6F320_SPHCR|nr:hypothetical protein Sphch_3221 [Sphingobium chlorophenolicum L-1]
MRVLLFGANGFLGASVARRLREAGHTISAMARNPESEAGLEQAGIAPVRGSFENLPALAQVAFGFDAIVFAAKIPFEAESSVVGPLLDSFAGTGKPFLFTSGTSCLSIPTPHGEWDQNSFSEDDDVEPMLWTGVRMKSEHLVRTAAANGVRSMVVRPPMIWGNGGGNGQVAWMFEAVERMGAACYLGMGLNLYSGVHVDDLADVYALALERGQAGALYHAVSGEVNWRTIAEAVGQVMGCPARSISYDEMCKLWGEQDAPYRFGVSSRSRAVKTREHLGWAPTRPDLIDDIRNGSYRARFASDSREIFEVE